MTDMDSIGPDDLDAIEERAARATPGPWETFVEAESTRGFVFGTDDYALARCLDKEASEADAAYIAAAHPQAVLALLDDLRDARELLGTFIDEEPCSLDHHGFCQAHGWFGERECNMARARRWLAPDPPAGT